MSKKKIKGLLEKKGGFWSKFKQGAGQALGAATGLAAGAAGAYGAGKLLAPNFTRGITEPLRTGAKIASAYGKSLNDADAAKAAADKLANTHGEAPDELTQGEIKASTGKKPYDPNKTQFNESIQVLEFLDNLNEQDFAAANDNLGNIVDNYLHSNIRDSYKSVKVFDNE